MKAVLEFFDASWLQILGYTLLNSLWEAFIVTAFVVLVLRFIPNRLSMVRYVAASFGLMTIVALLDRNFCISQYHLDPSNFFDEPGDSSRHYPTPSDQLHTRQ